MCMVLWSMLIYNGKASKGINVEGFVNIAAIEQACKGIHGKGGE